MKLRAASRIEPHWDPIELETSSTSDRSTMRRVASLELETVSSVKLPIRMKVVGTTAVARMVTMLSPVSSSTCIS